MAYDLDPLSTTDFPTKTNSDENGEPLETPYPELDTGLYFDADEYNRLAGAVIAHRTTVLDLDDRVTEIEGEGAPTSISDADGDTKVEVERTADDDTVYVRAGGVDVMQATKAETKASTEAVAGSVVTRRITNNMLGAGLQGAFDSIGDGESIAGSSHYRFVYTSPSGGGYENVITYNSDDQKARVFSSAEGGENKASAGIETNTSKCESYLKTSIDGGSGSAVLGISGGSSVAESSVQASVDDDAGTASVEVASTGSVDLKPFNAEAGADTIPVSDMGALALPAGVASIVDGITQALAGLPTSGTWNIATIDVSGISGVTSANLSSGLWSRSGDVVTCSGWLNASVSASGGYEIPFSAPVASAFTAQDEEGSTIALTDSGNVCYVGAYDTDRLYFSFESSGAGSVVLAFTLQYKVVEAA